MSLPLFKKININIKLFTFSNIKLYSYIIIFFIGKKNKNIKINNLISYF